MIQKVSIENAVGMVLAHDLTKIIPKEYKGAPFKKGYIIKEEDIEPLKKMGKYHINIIQIDEKRLHEEEAAYAIGMAAAGEGISLTKPSEGKVSLKANAKGLLKINKKLLEAVNEIDDIILSTRHTHTIVEANQIVAGTKVIPLVIEKDKITRVKKILEKEEPMVSIKPLMPLKVGIVVTGTEVYTGKIEDKFGQVLVDKAKDMGGIPFDVLFAPDEEDKITQCIHRHLEQGADLVMVSGGMAVDADDVTPNAIEKVSTEVISYGSPVLPGAMFMMAYRKDIPILGIPACGMFSKITVLDLILPRVFAKDKINKKDIISLAHGGLCLNCERCTYPVCPLGK
ncbi:molybdenum cofactor synthesis domain-containing protein [Natranaerovirga hydrolytica]|uniref:Molybdopterin molybdenumtransferase n=1 Tax=Natranaerovirga hydrolytica TaxID=680378 RepID=A0A4R1N196_9FIRM|nr:molybdopterin-binding protein [Natranaerovirga hydrolytica]TCK97764.1 molybdenum cofactor synthesis domain-containing protein [Natranaerovirga hydrolytica]